MTQAGVQEKFTEIIRRIVATAQPRKVVLFGSAAGGEMHANSDLDLLVVVAPGTHRRRTAQAIYRNLIGVGFAADIVVVTEEDLVRHRENPGMIISAALLNGREVYSA